jgi:hypothetical protein
MRKDEPGPGRSGSESAVSGRERVARGTGPAQGAGWIIETTVSPFHCLYQDALEFHKQSTLRQGRSEAEASRLARAALLLYVAAAEALVNQAAVELGRPELAHLAANPARPLPLADAWQLLPALVAEGPAGDPDAPPWPAFAELLTLRSTWAYPGPPSARRAYYRSPRRDGEYEPLQSHQIPAGLPISADTLVLPRSGLPRDPYALRPRHLDTARSLLDAAIEALDRRLGGALTKDGRHRKEPVQVVHPPDS